MSFIGKLFGKQKEQAKLVEPAVPPASAGGDPSKDPNMIRVYDQYGRELFITKEEWRKSVLPGSLQSNWNKPEELYGVILSALNDGFRADVVDAAKQLYKIDAIPERGTCVWGIVLMEEDRLKEAEKVYRDYIAQHGESGVILTNLAKVYSRRKDDKKSEEILWHALEVDPNQDNGLGWYTAIHRERGGEESGQDALRRIAALPGSWRARLWLGRAALAKGQLAQALQLYNEALSMVSRPVPADFLMQISGDLGNNGQLQEIINIVTPYFDIAQHGLQVGNNLIKANIDLGQMDAAQVILDQLYALKRPDWIPTLSFWGTELAKARLKTKSVDQKAPLNVVMLTGEGPIWLKPSSPAAELFPVKSRDAVIVCFLGCTGEMASNSKRIQHQLADAPGRMSRALPLFLAEQTDFNSNARVKTLVPWINSELAGFVFSGVAWNDEDAAQYARQDKTKSDYVVVTHLKLQTEPWVVELRLIRTIDGKCLGNLTSSMSCASPQDTIPDLAMKLLTLLAEHAEVKLQAQVPFYQVPSGQDFSYYLLRLEQLLAVRCGGMDEVPKGFLNGEREIIDGNIQLCLACPGNVCTRILLAQTLVAMKHVRPDILQEFKDKVTLLQKEKPLSEPAQSVVQRMINEVMGA